MHTTSTPALFRAFDAAYPPQQAPPNCQAVLGYLGGYATHTWTLDEWDRFKDYRQAGYWVYNAAWAKDGYGEGVEACTAARALGWIPFAENRRVIGNDMETAVNPAYCRDFQMACNVMGFTSFTYGSIGNILEDGDYGLGIVVANWNDVPQIDPATGVIGDQYLADQPWEDTTVDYTVFSGTVLKHFGVGPRVVVN
jgi:hypothetical protein